MNKVQPTTCQATSNLEISIPDTQGHNIVLYFYPKDATPGCTTLLIMLALLAKPLQHDL
jgi:peroxiredoxin Q/BCP